MIVLLLQTFINQQTYDTFLFDAQASGFADMATP
jgi:hypothetical protein